MCFLLQGWRESNLPFLKPKIRNSSNQDTQCCSWGRLEEPQQMMHIDSLKAHSWHCSWLPFPVGWAAAQQSSKSQTTGPNPLGINSKISDTVHRDPSTSRICKWRSPGTPHCTSVPSSSSWRKSCSKLQGVSASILSSNYLSLWLGGRNSGPRSPQNISAAWLYSQSTSPSTRQLLLTHRSGRQLQQLVARKWL